METPINCRNLRPRHVPTPKMSERKKSLFPDGSKSPIHLAIDEDSDLGPISPLNFSSSSSQSNSQGNQQYDKNLKKIEMISNKKNLRISFRNILNDLNGPKSTIILSTSPKSIQNDVNEEAISLVDGHIESNDNATDSFHVSFDGTNKENLSMKTPNEQIKMTSNIDILPKFRKILLEPNDQTPTSDESIVVHTKPQKRHYVATTPKSNAADSHSGILDWSPKVKLLKLDSKARTSLSFDECIPTKSFYSSSKNTHELQIPKIKSPEAKSISKCNLSTSSNNYRRLSSSHRKSLPRKSPSNTINRGVFHRVHKKRQKSFRGLMEPTRADTKFNAIKMKLLKKSILLDKTDEERENTRITMEQVSRINNILRNMKNPIEMAQPLTVFNPDAATDEMESTVETEPDLQDFDDTASVTIGTAPKKFFKSQKSVKNIYRITNRMSASVESGGRLALVQKHKNKSVEFSMDEIDFSDERKEVEGIIDKLYNQLVHDDHEDNDLNTSVETEPDHIEIDDQIEYYRTKLPPTIDANELERQENLLQFLTMNYMLDDYHFKIFILEPNKYSDEAKAILDQLVVVDDPVLVDTATTEQEINSDCPMSPTSQISNMTSELVLECPMDTEESNMQSQEENVHNNNNNESLKEAEEPRDFPIFKKGFQITNPPYEVTKPKRKNRIWIPIGADQYQIDAGQKRFGATKCAECGLLYSVHEPEEEIIHLNFHNSWKLLRYKGWQNERAVAEVAEWGLLGRIIMIVGSDPKFQLNRAKSVIHLANRELGFGSVELHSNSVVYLAIGKNIIMGFCVAEPISTAYRLIQNANDSTSYDANKPFPIKCGISKIWVAEAFRNQGVARHLVNAVRSNFVFGYCLSFEELACSSPTESGKILFKKLTNRSDILVYE